MSDIEVAEEIAEQLRFGTSFHSRDGLRCGASWRPSLNITHAHAVRPVQEAAASVELRGPEASEPTEHPPGLDVTSYTELMAGIQAQIAALGIRQLDFDKLAGFAPGLSGKVFGPSQVKRLGPEKLFDAIRAAALKLRLEPDPDQLQKLSKQIAETCQPRQASQARFKNDSRKSKGRKKPRPTAKRRIKRVKPTRGKPYLSAASNGASR